MRSIAMNKIKTKPSFFTSESHDLFNNSCAYLAVEIVRISWLSVV
jgi:hypothetical protein